MSRATAVRLAILYCLIAAVAGYYLAEIRSPGGYFGTALGFVLMSAALPMLIWAFSLFRLENAVIPFILWPLLMAAAIFFMHYNQTRWLVQ